MKYYAVIDTNVLVSALIKSREDSAPVRTILKIFEGTIIPVYSKDIVAEYTEVLARKKFADKFSSHAKKQLIQAIIDNGIELSGIQTDEQPSDPKDIVFYEVTMDSRQTKDTFLITGNIRDFPVRPFIVTPTEMLHIIEENRK